MARLKDRRAIYHLQKYLNNADDDVQAKALEAIDLLQNCG
jgi:HEAT repeat protein